MGFFVCVSVGGYESFPREGVVVGCGPVPCPDDVFEEGAGSGVVGDDFSDDAVVAVSVFAPGGGDECSWAGACDDVAECAGDGAAVFAGVSVGEAEESDVGVGCEVGECGAGFVFAGCGECGVVGV